MINKTVLSFAGCDEDETDSHTRTIFCNFNTISVVFFYRNALIPYYFSQP